MDKHFLAELHALAMAFSSCTQSWFYKLGACWFMVSIRPQWGVPRLKHWRLYKSLILKSSPTPEQLRFFYFPVWALWKCPERDLQVWTCHFLTVSLIPQQFCAISHWQKPFVCNKKSFGLWLMAERCGKSQVSLHLSRSRQCGDQIVDKINK